MDRCSAACTRVVVVFGLCLIALAAAPALAQYTVSLDPSVRYQTIRGWGVTLNGDMPDALRGQLLDEAVDQFGLTRVRFEPPGGNRATDRRWEWRNDNDDPNTIDWSAFNTADFDERVTTWTQPFRQRVEANGDPFEIYISPSLFDSGSSGSVPPWLLHSPGEYAEYALSMLLHLRDVHGIEADYYCILNEAGNSNPFTPQVVARMIKVLGPQLAEHGLSTRIQFPESITANTAWSYIQATQNDPDIWPYIGLISYHLYGDNSMRPQIRDFAWARGIETAQTEFMGLELRHFYDDIVQGGVSVWEIYGLGQFLSPDRNGTSFTRGANYWYLRQALHYIRPGAVRIQAASDYPGVLALAFVRDGRVTLLLNNRYGGAPNLQVTLTGLPVDQYGVSQTLRGEPYAEVGLTSPDAEGTLVVTIPAYAAMTIYPYSGSNNVPVFIDWKATPGYLALPAGTATLSAAATDPELDPISYTWTVRTAPAGANVVLATPDAATTEATGLTVAGQYVFTVTADDGTGSASRDVYLNVHATNQPPVLSDVHNRIPVQIFLPTTSASLRGVAQDLENDPVTYRWSVVSQPDDANAVITNPAANSTTLTDLTVPGEYVFRLEASDPTHTVSQELTVPVYPEGSAPEAAVSAAPAEFRLPRTSTQLSSITSDPDGDVITHWWSVKDAPAGTRPVLATPGAADTAVSGLTAAGTYTFHLAVIDGNKLTERDVTVTVGAWWPGDTDGDGEVQLNDIMAVVEAFGSQPGDARWAPHADFDGDNQISVLDVVTAVVAFGTSADQGPG